MFVKSKGVLVVQWNPNDIDHLGHLKDGIFTVGIAERIVHERYNPYSSNREHDIALLELVGPMGYSSWFVPLCMPLTSSLRDTDYGRQTIFVVPGWSVVSVFSKLSNSPNVI